MLCTLEQVKEFLGIDNADSDTVISSLILYADRAIKTECSRELEQAVVADEPHQTDGIQRDFFVEEYPINSVDALTVTFDGDELENYEVDYLRGIIYMTTPPQQSPTKFKVSYTGGYDPIPDDLSMVCVMLTSDLFKAGGGGNASGVGSGSGEIKSEHLKDYTVNYAVSESIQGVSDLSSMISKYNTVLDNYKKKNI